MSDATRNLPGGATFVVKRSAAETGGERVDLEMTIPPDSPGPPAHLHPRQEEQWHVLAGTLEVLLDGDWRTLREGESVTIAPGQVHTLRNPTGDDVRVLDVHIPALDFQDYMEEMARLTEEGKITSLRSPRSLVYLATLLHRHRTTQLTASRPQRIAESGIAGLGKLLRVDVR